MFVLYERRVRLPPDSQAPGRARRMLQDVLAGAGLPDELADTAVLLASELCENAVLHAGTEFEVDVRVLTDEVVVTVSDRGPGPLELHLAQPRRRYGRAATHGRGLALVQRLASAWGTRHEADGTHRTWFSLGRAPRPHDGNGLAGPADGADGTGPLQVRPPRRHGSGADRYHRMLHLPAHLAERLEGEELVAELVRRLREELGARAVLAEVDTGEGTGMREIARDGPADGAGLARVVRLPVAAPLRGRLRVVPAQPEPGPAGRAGPPDTESRDLTEIAAQRIATAVESQWLREVEQRRRAWMTYLAEISALLGQSLDVDLTVAVVPQVVVPRLGSWCAVHLHTGDSAAGAADAASGLRLAALTHADEDRLAELRDALEPRPPAELSAALAGLVHGGATAPPARFGLPTDGVAVPLVTRGRVIGTLTAGRPRGHGHTPEDVVMLGDVARRAALAIHNAQTTAAHVAVSQALQHALLPRALPRAPGVEFAAAYLPATSGSDVGGDFYDVLTVESGHGCGRWLVAIGDVCGTGARAAARTGQVRDVLRVLVRDGRSLPRAVELLNDVLMDAGDPLLYSTVAVATVRRRARGNGAGLEVELVLGGHLKPVLVRAGGGAGFVGRYGTALGLLPEVAVTCTRHHLAPGDALLLYTDGVTERRRDGEQFGPERLLAATAGAAGAGAEDLVGAVRGAVRCWSDEPEDDIALLAVRATPAP